ncbi:hypothetical protein JTP67_33630, partial [Streptomyces sp. S12]|nr:hypothetical protein [Streptomyces sp. S12]
AEGALHAVLLRAEMFIDMQIVAVRVAPGERPIAGANGGRIGNPPAPSQSPTQADRPRSAEPATTGALIDAFDNTAPASHRKASPAPARKRA